MAVLLDGKGIAGIIREEIREEIVRFQARGIRPKLAVILVGDDPASAVYARSKQKVCQETGMLFELFVMPAQTSEEEIISRIESLNDDPGVHGILLELPLPEGLRKERVFAALRPDKDVDGVHPMNRGHILSGEDGLFPATPQSCTELILRSGLEIAGKHVVIVGRGETVGKPLIFMMLRHNATVTVCHSRTADLGAFTRQADILITAVGRAGMIGKEMVRPGAIVVDAGINETADGICGDVDFAAVQETAGYISPVPGGVGALTTTLLLRNVLKGIALQGGHDS